MRKMNRRTLVAIARLLSKQQRADRIYARRCRLDDAGHESTITRAAWGLAMCDVRAAEHGVERTVQGRHWMTCEIAQAMQWEIDRACECNGPRGSQ